MASIVTTTYFLSLCVLAVYGLHRLHLVVVALMRCRYIDTSSRLPLPLGDLPRVTVQLPLYNELYVAERAIECAAAMDWPCDRLEIQVLDDSTDETREICSHCIAKYSSAGLNIVHLHRTSRVGYKAGALAAGLRAAHGEFLLVLDADFLPPRDFLRRTIGHFSEPNVAMVQARWGHLNRDFSLLTRVQGLLLDGHFVIEQGARSATGRFFNFNGTAGVWRRSAIEAAGGWTYDTLTEDLDLSYRALLMGWQFKYLVDITVPAELPVSMNGFRSQQFRWAKGAIQVARKVLPKVLRSQIPWQTKLEALLHLTQSFAYAATFVLMLSFLALVFVRADAVAAYSTMFQIGAVGVLSVYCCATGYVLGGWRDFLRNAGLVPAVAVVAAGISISQTQAVTEALFGKPSEFIRTPKHGITSKGQGWRHKRYRGTRSVLPVIEVVTSICLFALSGYTAYSDQWWRALASGGFAVGFGYVGVLSKVRRG